MSFENVVMLNGRYFVASNKHGDHIAESLRHGIDQYRVATFERFLDINLDISPLPAPNAHSLTDLDGKWIGYDKYEFDTWGKESRSMRVRVGGNDMIRVLHCGRWVAVAEYLRHIERQINPDYLACPPQNRCVWQWKWWATNGKKFRLQDVPSEVRDIIYDFTFGPKIEPFPTSKARRLGKRTDAILARQPNSSLLVLNKRMGREAADMLYFYTPFLVEHFGIMRRLMANINLRENIRQLELALSHRDFFRLFGWNFGEVFSYNPSRAVCGLREMKLNRLELNIAPPSLTTETTWLDCACQKTVVGWILEAAWPRVRGHPVEVTGYVKEGQKREFEEACSAERNRLRLWRLQRLAAGLTVGSLEEYDEWLEFVGDEIGGVSLTGGDQQDMGVENLPSSQDYELPPMCRCFVPCTVKTWTAKG